MSLEMQIRSICNRIKDSKELCLELNLSPEPFKNIGYWIFDREQMLTRSIKIFQIPPSSSTFRLLLLNSPIDGVFG